MKATKGFVLSVSMAAMVSGCGDAFESPATLRELRVLGVRIDTPYAKPGKPVNLEMLYFDGSPRAYLPDGSKNPERKVSIVWLGGCHNPPGDLYFGCFEIIGQKLAGLNMQGNVPPSELAKFVQVGTKATFDIPSDIISSRPQLPGEVPYGLSYVFFVACGGDLGPPPKGASLPIGCYGPNDEPLGPDDFVVGFTPIYVYETLTNKNPVIVGTRFDKVDIRPQACSSDADCAGASKCGSSGVCIPRVPHCTAKKVKDCKTYEFEPVLNEADNVEDDLVSPPLDGRPAKESMWVSYFATDGTIGSELMLISDSAKGWVGSWPTTWSAPNAPAGEVRLWAIVRDNRGGQAWIWQDLWVD